MLRYDVAMTLKAGTCVLGFVALLGACGVGDESGPNDDPDTVLGAKCRAHYNLSGSWVAEAPTRPADVGGCWPVGTWTFTAQQTDNECGYTPELKPSYSFRVMRTEAGDGTGLEETYAYLTEPSIMYRLKVTEGGALDCSGDLELFSGDGMKVFNLKPSQRDATIAGLGEFTEYDSNQWDP